MSDLKRQMADLKRQLRVVQRAAGSRVAETAVPEGEAIKLHRIRPTGPMVRKLRNRLGLTQADFAKLVKVSNLTISNWESASGRIFLRKRTLAALGKIRGLGKQAAKKMLAGD